MDSSCSAQLDVLHPSDRPAVAANRRCSPGVFRQVVPGFILTDLVFALGFTYLFVKVAAALGGGRMAGVKLGLLVAVLSPVIGTLYKYFSVTYMPVGLTSVEAFSQVIAHAIEGAVAGATYKR